MNPTLDPTKIGTALCRGARALAFALLVGSFAAPSPALAQTVRENGDRLVQLDFDDVELAVVIETIARLTEKNFIYDDRVRGRVTIVSPSQVTLDQAYAVFESVLEVKGFTTLEGPGGVVKIIPVRQAKESSIDTVRSGKSPKRDNFVTRLIPLKYIDATQITNTIKPLIGKDAAMVAYAPTNTIILTDTQSNIGRILSILDAIDVETYREDLAVIKIQHADAAVLGGQISEIYGAEVSSTGSSSRSRTPRRSSRSRTTTPTPAAGDNPNAPGAKVRLITDERTNSLIVLAPRAQIQDVRDLVRKLDIEVTGGGRIHVYYLKHADSEELAQTLQSLLSGQPRAGAGGGGGATAGAPGGGAAQSLRAAVTELAEGITVTADPATNSLVIQASKEGYQTLRTVIEKLDIQRPQVLVEALIMEVSVSDDSALGFNFAVQFLNGDDQTEMILQTLGAAVTGTPNIGTAATGIGFAEPFVDGGTLAQDTRGSTAIQAMITATASDSRVNVLSAPHILTSDNEEAEIQIGNNIPIPTSRVQSAQGVNDGLSSSVNIERQDIGVTLRVTPQISEGDTLRLEIFQEITDVNTDLTGQTGDATQVGVSLTNRQVENTVVVADGETVVIGGLISETNDSAQNKVPFLGDIPVLGWAFKTRTTDQMKQNLLIFLTPHIIRSKEDLEFATIQKREELRASAGEGLELSSRERSEAEELGLSFEAYRGSDPVRGALFDHRDRYPLRRMREIEENRSGGHSSDSYNRGSVRYAVRAGVFRDELRASRTLTELIDAGYDGTLVSGELDDELMYEIVVGPYDELRDAQTASDMLRAAYDLDSSVTVTEER